MNTRKLGSTDVEVTELGYGAAQIGNLYAPVDDDTAAAAVDAAWEEGIRYFDTAPHYGLGLSERRLGAALGRRPRDEFVVSTKVGRLLVPNAAPSGSDLEELIGAGGQREGGNRFLLKTGRQSLLRSARTQLCCPRVPHRRSN